MRRRTWSSCGLFVLLLVCLVLPPLASAQTPPILLTVSVSRFFSDIVNSTFFKKFEEENTNTKVNVIYSDPRSDGKYFLFPSAAEDVADHFNSVDHYVHSADVLMATVGDVTTDISVEATRAGYFLNLAPLIAEDTKFDSADFLPPAWQSVQWDGGVWLLPVAQNVSLFLYDAKAFDAAGLAYPNDHWTLEDYARAAEKLTVRDANGQAIIPGLMAFNRGGYAFFRSLLAQGVYNSDVVPSVPVLTRKENVALVQRWAELIKEGAVWSPSFPDTDLSKVPLIIDNGWMLSVSNFKGALLPGGTASAIIFGFSVSGSSQYPQQAYALAKYLANDIRVANMFFGLVYARKSLAGIALPEGEPYAIRSFSKESDALLKTAVEHAIPVSETRYMNYVVWALWHMQANNWDAETALRQAELQAQKNLSIADKQRGATVSPIATPVPTLALAANKISLNFHVEIPPLIPPDQEQWQRVITEFVATDSEVARIVLDTDLRSPAAAAQKSDCFYLPYNAVPELGPQHVLSLDPLLDADPAFDRQDIPGNILGQLQSDQKLLAVPISLNPHLLRYSVQAFRKANLPLPDNAWSISTFVDALKTLKAASTSGAPLTIRDRDGTYLLLLIAAYGGLPLDYRTQPVTVDFTSPQSIAAIRQVLSLVKDGAIDYHELAVLTSNISTTQSPLYADSFASFQVAPDYQPVLYPIGKQVSAIAYDVGAAYISNQAANPAACYRWISFLTRHPELFTGMPVRSSALNDPALVAAQGQGVVDFYRAVDSRLRDPNTIAIPSASGGAVLDFPAQYWLFRAFDRYLLKNADLESELVSAQQTTRAYLDCLASSVLTANVQTDSQRQLECARKADPDPDSVFNLTLKH